MGGPRFRVLREVDAVNRKRKRPVTVHLQFYITVLIIKKLIVLLLFTAIIVILQTSHHLGISASIVNEPEYLADEVEGSSAYPESTSMASNISDVSATTPITVVYNDSNFFTQQESITANSSSVSVPTTASSLNISNWNSSDTAANASDAFNSDLAGWNSSDQGKSVFSSANAFNLSDANWTLSDQGRDISANNNATTPIAANVALGSMDYVAPLPFGGFLGSFNNGGPQFSRNKDDSSEEKDRESEEVLPMIKAPKNLEGCKHSEKKHKDEEDSLEKKSAQSDQKTR